MTYLLIALAILIFIGAWLIRSAWKYEHKQSLLVALLIILPLLVGGYMMPTFMGASSWEGVFALGGTASFLSGIVAVVCGHYGRWNMKMKVLHCVCMLLFGVNIILCTHYLYVDTRWPPIPIGYGLLDFLIPVSFWELWEVLSFIPAVLYDDWCYPVEEGYEEIAENDMRDLLVIALKLRKNASSGLSGFRARAPRHVTWGVFFYHFINDYNARHPEHQIDIFDEDRQGYRWRCYRVRKCWWPSVIDPNLPIYSSGIRENSIILCERIHQLKIETCDQ
ncbi:MAG: hypothetical protein JO154_11575 [Chitinophaga sp.]|uniref:TssN family type VI secretion system protein n=1 Tax=Chitinophaga sp. TaxID=1869181 RepID=UPI0025B7F676|nr:TssN family type VI secretion system protein [Chitinophaga sp.]MBV8253237.1 hypothetical protein [Chitinophaga sp.]